MRNRFWRGLVLIATATALASGACSIIEQTTPTPTLTPAPTETATPQTTDTPAPTPTRGLAMPADGELLEERRVDLDEDGIEEHIVTYRGGAGDGLAIDEWEFLLPESQVVERLQARKLAVGGPIYVLLYTTSAFDIWHYLHLFEPTDDGYALVRLLGGPLDGERVFRSAYYRPVVQDGDFNGTEEIAICMPSENPDYVEVFYYDWDEVDEVYRYTTIFIAQPLRVPATATPTG